MVFQVIATSIFLGGKEGETIEIDSRESTEKNETVKTDKGLIDIGKS